MYALITAESKDKVNQILNNIQLAEEDATGKNFV